jgi:hypothetical protein
VVLIQIYIFFSQFLLENDNNETIYVKYLLYSAVDVIIDNQVSIPHIHQMLINGTDFKVIYIMMTVMKSHSYNFEYDTYQNYLGK